MLKLQELQKQFSENLRNPYQGALEFIRQDAILPLQQHFSIYQNSIRGARQKILQEIYPVCNKLVGNDFFIAMVNEYITRTPCNSPDLGNYGNTLPDFIAHFTPARSLPYLADVAYLEWAWHRVFHAKESKILDLEKLSACYKTVGESIIFSLPLESSLLCSKFPIHHIWEVNQDDSIGEEIITLNTNEDYFFLVWRKQLSMRIDMLTRNEWQILTWIKQSLPLGIIAENIENYFPDIELSEILSKCFHQGWLCDFIICTSENRSVPLPLS